MRAGRWRGAVVAVKVVAHDRSIASLAETLRESALSTSIQHPNVVRAPSPPAVFQLRKRRGMPAPGGGVQMFLKGKLCSTPTGRLLVLVAYTVDCQGRTLGLVTLSQRAGRARMLRRQMGSAVVSVEKAPQPVSCVGQSCCLLQGRSILSPRGGVCAQAPAFRV